MKLRFRGTLCSCVFFLIPAAYVSAQTPTEQTPPPAQTPPTVPGTPPIPKPTVQMPPSNPQAQLPATVPSKERDTGGDAISVEPFIWMVQSTISVRGGQNVTVSDPGQLRFPGSAKFAEGVVITAPTSKENSLEFTFWQVKAQGNTVLPITENYFGNDFASLDTLNTAWIERNYKLSWNYLTWPYPSNGAKFRVKALFEMDYSQISVNYAAPLDPNAITTNGTKQIILPSLGMGIEYHPARHLRLEMKASGFVIWHHADLWSAEANAVLRLGKIEATVGVRAFHDKSSPEQDEYYSQSMYGPWAGVRWIFK